MSTQTWSEKYKAQISELVFVVSCENNVTPQRAERPMWAVKRSEK